MNLLTVEKPELTQVNSEAKRYESYIQTSASVLSSLILFRRGI